MIHVIAAITTTPEGRPELIAAFAKLIPQVRAEQGCIEYSTAVDVATGLPTQSPQRDDVLVVVEKWESLEALKAHLDAPHMISFREANAHLLKGLSLQVLEPA